jgi:predicted nucleic acid-binding Zn ribbon protein
VNCPKCHKPNVENAKFCSHCGEPLQTKQKTRQTYDNCTNCGAKLAPDASYCNKCGAAVIKLPKSSRSSARAQDAPIPPPLQVATTKGDRKDPSDRFGRNVSSSTRRDYYTDLSDSGKTGTGAETQKSTSRRRRSSSADDQLVGRRSGYSYQDDFGGDRYADGIYDDYEDSYEDYDDDFDEYEYERPRRSPARLILTIALALIALAVVIGIVTVVRQLVNDPPLTNESQDLVVQVSTTTTPSTTVPTTTTPPTTTTRPTPPSTTPTTTPPSTTETTTTTTPSSTVEEETGSIMISGNTGYVIRSGPGTSYDRLGLIAPGSSFVPVDLVQGEYAEGIGDQWYKIIVDGREAYVIQDPSGQQ